MCIIISLSQSYLFMTFAVRGALLMSMNILATKGSKVRFVNEGGWSILQFTKDIIQQKKNHKKRDRSSYPVSFLIYLSDNNIARIFLSMVVL
jgi:hypothetical protein